MAETKTQLENENLQIDVAHNPGCRITFNITVTPKATQVAQEKAIKNINKEVSLPGFRKGKAPANLILQNYGKYIEREWKDILINTAFREALSMSKLLPFDDEKVKARVQDSSVEQGARIEIEFEAQPKVPEINPKELQLKAVDPRPVSDDDVEQTIQNVRMYHANWTEITDRGAEEGDFIDIDVINADDPSVVLCQDQRFEIKKGVMGEWMRKIVLGLKVNESTTGMSEPSEGIDKDKFKPTNCKITIKAIKTAELPEVNDEFAKTVGVDTVDELKTRIRADLERQSENEVEEQLHEQLENALLDLYPFEIPYSLVASEKNRQVQRIKANMTAEEKETRQNEIEKQAVNDISRAFRLLFIANKIARDYTIEVSDEEVSRALLKELYSASPEMRQYFANSDMDALRARMHSNILSRKAKDYLIQHATIR